ncbi:hypothetical protein FE257_009465 [Aspergillus nanangensis]|uniref:Zn(2)-C6 fungal-type domain-containing protein n=1 Tax=Aspergillus nanangensis TaxID=2582783 RepID=A0AAD4CLH5_ASPNN|nr:hypothetical protein FE257_009465 [Aspergillus nanangensis]
MVTESGSSNPAKRRRNRVAVSCFSCRALKTKCDGVRPSCSTCAHNGRHCTWMQQGTPGGKNNKVLVKEDYLRELEKRLAAVEGGGGGAKKNPPSASEAPSNTSSQYHQASSLALCTPSSMVAQSDPSPLPSSSILVDHNVSIGISFTQLILNSIYGSESIRAQSMTASRDVRPNPPLSDEDLYALPADTAAVLGRYFASRHILTPLFHQPSAQVMFDAAINCSQEERPHHRSTLVLLNMILALCTSHWLVDKETHPARKHYDIAMTLLQPTLLRDWTLETVQGLLLGARYLQTTSCGDECWNLVGLAVRIAHGLRLHQDPPNTDPPPLRETKRRVWYVAYMLDMHWSMIYERPPAIRSSDFSVGLPEDLEDSCIQADRILYPMPRKPSFISFFLQNVNLYRIVEKAMVLICESGSDVRSTAELVISLDEDYRTWLRQLPAHLILDRNDAQEPAWILALRGNMSLKVSLHGREKPEQSEESLINHNLRSSQKICVAAAIESIDIVALRHEQTRKTMGLNWFNIYYLFNAVIVLVSYIINPFYTHDRAALDQMEKALHMIKSMSSNHSFAKWAYSFLQQLIGYMHQSLGTQHGKPQNDRSTEAVPPPPHQTTDLTRLSGESDPFSDLQSLFGFAQDLSDNLETQFGHFYSQSLPESMWMFNEGSTFDEYSQGEGRA